MNLGWGEARGRGAPRPSPADACVLACVFTSVTEEALDRHPERRMRAAFTAFEEAQLPRLKQENPNMRLSQLKQMLKKEWLRSPDNPMNQRAVPFNTPK